MFAVIATVVLCGIALYYKNEADTYIEESQNWKRHTDTSKRFFCWTKRCAFVLFISFFINTFVPTTNEALLIYGVGGMIDYIKSNDTAKQLPNKCVKALDKYLDNLTKEEKQNDNEIK